MSDAGWYAITLDKATDAHREAVQAIVRVHSRDWWHHFADLWIVSGQTSTYWRDLIQPTLLNSTAAVLVFKLPELAGRSWASVRVPREGNKWLHDTYSQMPRPRPVPVLGASTR